MCLDAIGEREMVMSMAHAFWLETLRDYVIDRPVALPFDRHRSANEQRSGRGTFASFDFGEDLSRAFLHYAAQNNTTAEQLSLACYFAFLFKLTNGERDLCVGVNTHGRYKDEFESIIGMFVNAIPLRLRDLDPSVSFAGLVQQVREMATRALQMSYFPLQRILSQHSQSKESPTFLDTSFEYGWTEGNTSRVQMSNGEVVLLAIPYSTEISAEEIVSKFDFSLRFRHDKSNEQLSCRIDASLDLFDKTTVQTIAQRFHAVLQQLFLLDTFDTINQPIFELSLLLPNDLELLRTINPNTNQSDFHRFSYLPEEFGRQASLHPQKISVVLDEQSLTYAEILANVCRLMTYLGKRQHPCDIICQCVERSIEMIIGQLAIVSLGGCYCPLSPNDSSTRLTALVRQTKSQLILVHPATAWHFGSDERVVDLHKCLLANETIGDTDVNTRRYSVCAEDLA